MPARKKTVEVPVEFLRGLAKTIRADMKFQHGLAVSQWVDRLEGLLKDDGGVGSGNGGKEKK